MVFDLPSTPIYEILSTKTQVILYLDSVIPFTEEALNLLNKRVYTCSSIEEVNNYIDMYSSNTLKLKYNERILQSLC